MQHSTITLPEESSLKRLPRAPKRQRSEKFWSQFETRILFYDCFWRDNSRDVLLVSPPPLNLMDAYNAAEYVAQPSGQILKPVYHVSRSTMVTEFKDVPAGTDFILFKFNGYDFEIKVQDNLSDQFAGKKVLFTMNKNNELGWIKTWASWYATLHGTDTVIIIDNGSTEYTVQELEAAILSVEGITTVSVINWPFRYGPHDPAVIFHRYWANFLQVSSYVMMFRRLTARAAGIINCDIDELIGRDSKADAYTLAQASELGLLTCKGTWIENARAAEDVSEHEHFNYRYKNKSYFKSVCANKWVLDPQKSWCKDITVMPSVHRIFGIPKALGRNAEKLPFWHFKGVNTNWKTNRKTEGSFDTAGLVRDSALDNEIKLYQKMTS